MDTFHFHLSQIPDVEVRAIPREKLLLVHVNDAEDLPVEKLRDGHRLHVGLGVLPLVETFRTLNEIGYAGYLSIELFREEYLVFPGRNESVSEEQNYEDISEFFEGLLATGKGGTKVLIENWPGMNKNFVATTPGGWRRLFFLVKSRGEMNWREFLGLLAGEAGFSGFASIEHEDREFGWPEGAVEARKEGLVRALAVLRG